MKATTQRPSIDTAAYAHYLRTVEGRLRADLAWENLRRFLPSDSQRRALDVGGGTGEMALRLAAAGFEVTLLDASGTMLAEAERAATDAGLRTRITFLQADADQVSRLFPPSSFNVIACHNLLEFVDRPSAILQSIKPLLAPSTGAVGSVIVRNRAGEVLQAALKAGDLDLAERNLTAPKVRAKLIDEMVTVFTPAELRTLLTDSGLDVIAEYGIRVFSDYLPQQLADDPLNYPRLLALEQKLGAHAGFAAIARYTQMIAGPAGNRAQRQIP